VIDVVPYANQVTVPVSTKKPQSIFPTLRIVSIDKLVPHEHYDSARASALQTRLMRDGVLRNPPIVVPLQGVTGNYMVLDGANRINALKMMKVPHILVQVACPGDPGFELSGWNQVVLGIGAEELLSILDSIPEISLKKEQAMRSGTESCGSSVLIQVHLASYEIYNVISRSSDLQVRTQVLNFILARIGQNARLDRTHLDGLDVLADLHPDLAGLIVFPCYEFDEIVKLVEGGQMIPAGITRFLISPRALRVNYNISDLRSSQALVEKNEILTKWTQERVSQKGVRVYRETTVMFDE
jgi:hypothetical protein